jgi:hypothetical protein
MATPNNDPIYSKAGDQTTNGTTGMNQPILTAANDFTGISANNALVFTAGANGAYIRSIKMKAAGTNASATVMRLFLNNGSTNATATNNTFIGEINLPATTASATAITSAEFEFPMGYAIPASFRIYAGVGTTVAAGWFCLPIAGQY